MFCATPKIRIFIFAFLGILFLKNNTEIMATEPIESEMQEVRRVNHPPLGSTSNAGKLDADTAFATYLARIAPLESNESRKERRENWKDKVAIAAPFAAVGTIAIKNAFESLSPIQLAGGLVSGWLLADLYTGLIHFTFDNLDWQTPKLPVELRKIALTFQWHHDYPAAATSSSYWGLSREFYLALLPVLAMSLPLSYYGYDMSSYILASSLIIGVHGHYVHALTHGKHRKNPIVKALQKCRIIDTKKSHDLHHRHPEHAVHYCLYSGHMNIVLDPVIATCRAVYKFFRKWCGTKPNKEE